MFKNLVDMSEHIDQVEATQTIHENIYFRGPNVFILACAIIIASVGLNVNSIPVIIGAMLISPVMGPILGFGFGLGTRDNKLVKDALKNFAIMVAISIISSTLYFVLSPLNLVHPTELLARTNPTIYDVLIAAFGGIAGILEISRKKKGTVLAGVAIATALMPPLCTVGYGISLLNWKYIVGALYLFLINSIFIALATFLAVKYLKYPVVANEEQGHKLTPVMTWVLMLIIIVPSVLTAVRMIQDNNFNINVSRLVEENKSIGGSFIYDYKVDKSVKPVKVELYMAGEELSPEQKKFLYANAERYGLSAEQIVFHEDATVSRNPISETEIVRGIYEHAEKQVKVLNDSIAALGRELALYKAKALPTESILRELRAQCAEVVDFTLTQGESLSYVAGAGNDSDAVIVADMVHRPSTVAIITTSKPVPSATRETLERFLGARLETDDLLVFFRTASK